MGLVVLVAGADLLGQVVQGYVQLVRYLGVVEVEADLLELIQLEAAAGVPESEAWLYAAGFFAALYGVAYGCIPVDFRDEADEIPF